MDSRQQCNSEGCITRGVGSNNLSVSTYPLGTQGTSEGEGSGNPRDPCLSSLAQFPLVATGSGSSSGTPTTSASLSSGTLFNKGSSSSIPGSLGGNPPVWRETYNAQLDNEDIQFLSHHLATGTTTGYHSVMRSFSVFCQSFGADPISCSPSILVKYIRHIMKMVLSTVP